MVMLMTRDEIRSTKKVQKQACYSPLIGRHALKIKKAGLGHKSSKHLLVESRRLDIEAMESSIDGQAFSCCSVIGHRFGFSPGNLVKITFLLFQ